MLTIISGAQFGADIAALKAAKAFGIPTGGYMTKGCRTHNGPMYIYLEKYNLKECETSDYASRTEANVKYSDGTIRFAKNFGSPGEKCTLNAIKKLNKPYFDIDIKNAPRHEKLIQWIKDNKIKILNIAGNSELTCPGIEKFVFNYLEVVFWNLQNEKNNRHVSSL